MRASGPLKLVWIDCPYPIATAGLAKTFEDEARVHIGREAPSEGEPWLVILGTDDAESLSDGVRRVREAYSDALILVFGLHLDLSLARAALQVGTHGFIHAGMRSEQVLRAAKVAAEGELVAPRQLLKYLVNNEGLGVLDALSHRQREILDLVVEGLSNAQIAKKLYLTESTVKQHLRAAYKLLGVNNRKDAARLLRKGSNINH